MRYTRRALGMVRGVQKHELSLLQYSGCEGEQMRPRPASISASQVLKSVLRLQSPSVQCQARGRSSLSGSLRVPSFSFSTFPPVPPSLQL